MNQRFLIDTHCWLWWNGTPERLAPTVRTLIADASNEILFSTASAWEIAIKHGLGKLKLPDDPDSYIPERLMTNRMRVLPIGLTHTLGIGRLPLHHRDPFDRILIAQAQTENLIVITADRLFSLYDIEVLQAKV